MSKARTLTKTFRHELSEPGPERLLYVADAFRHGMSVEDVHGLSQDRPVVLAPGLGPGRRRAEPCGPVRCPTSITTQLRRLKQKGFSDRRLATLLKTSEDEVRAYAPRAVGCDPCSSGWIRVPRSSMRSHRICTRPTRRSARHSRREAKKIMVLGGGPNRIGQGIEFDYCCVQAALAMRRTGTRASWSTATRRRCRPTTTPPTVCTSSR